MYAKGPDMSRTTRPRMSCTRWMRSPSAEYGNQCFVFMADTEYQRIRVLGQMGFRSPYTERANTSGPLWQVTVGQPLPLIT